jgi:hypothetical protein
MSNYFTQEFAALSDSRKIEELVAQLTKIAMHNDCDTEAVMQAINDVAEMRQVVAK